MPLEIGKFPKSVGPKNPPKLAKAFTNAIPAGAVDSVKNKVIKEKKAPINPYNPIAAKASADIIKTALSARPHIIKPIPAIDRLTIK